MQACAHEQHAHAQHGAFKLAHVTVVHNSVLRLTLGWQCVRTTPCRSICSTSRVQMGCTRRLSCGHMLNLSGERTLHRASESAHDAHV